MQNGLDKESNNPQEIELSDKDSTDTNESEFDKKCNAVLEQLANSYKQSRELVRNLMKVHKQEMKLLKKGYKKKKEPIETGFTKPETVPLVLAKLVGLPKDSVMPRTELTKKVYKVFKDRNLFYEKDKRVLRVDKELKKIFNLTDDVNKSIDPKDKNGINFYNFQKYIAKCYNDELTNTKKDNIKTVSV